MAKTVEQIAKDLNLSVTTVRLVLSGKAEQYRISVKTQSRINEHVERFGYTLNHSARSLKLNKTETLGLIVPNIVSLARGDDLRSNLPWVCLLGIGLVTVCDLLGRVIIMPFEIPVSLILGIVGSVVFVVLLLRQRRRG